MDILQAVSLRGIVPVIKLNRPEDAVPLCGALSRGRLPVAEITFRTRRGRRIHPPGACRTARRPAGRGHGADVRAGGPRRGRGRRLYRVPGAQSPGGAALPGPRSAGAARLRLPVGYGARAGTGAEDRQVFPRRNPGGVAAIKAMSAPYGGLTFVPTGGIDRKEAARLPGF